MSFQIDSKTRGASTFAPIPAGENKVQLVEIGIGDTKSDDKYLFFEFIDANDRTFRHSVFDASDNKKQMEMKMSQIKEIIDAYGLEIKEQVVDGKTVSEIRGEHWDDIVQSIFAFFNKAENVAKLKDKTMWLKLTYKLDYLKGGIQIGISPFIEKFVEDKPSHLQIVPGKETTDIVVYEEYMKNKATAKDAKPAATKLSNMLGGNGAATKPSF